MVNIIYYGSEVKLVLTVLKWVYYNDRLKHNLILI